MKEDKNPIPFDHAYWFLLSKDLIRNALMIQNEAAAKLQNMLFWLWTIYTAGVSIGASLSTISYSLLFTLLIASPSIILIMAYCLAVHVQMPSNVVFDPRIPKDIEEKYLAIINQKKTKLYLALAMTFVSAVLVSLAIFSIFVTKPYAKPRLLVHSFAQKNKTAFAVYGELVPEKEINVTLSNMVIDGPILQQKWVYKTASNGKFEKTILPRFTAKKYKLSVEWQEKDELKHILSKIIKVE